MEINAWSFKYEGSSIVGNTVINQARVMEDQCGVDVVALGPTSVPSSLSQQENNVQCANAEIGVFCDHVEDLESMLLMQPTDPKFMKWLWGDCQTYEKSAIQSDQGSTTLDTVMFGQDSWSSNQNQPDYPLGDNMPNGFILHDYLTGLTSSCPHKPCFAISPPSPPNSELKSFHTSYTFVPLSLSPSSYLHGISFNLPYRTTQVFVPSAISPHTMNMEETRRHLLPDPSSFVGTLSLSPNVSTTEEYYVHQSDLVENSMPEVQLSHDYTYPLHQSRAVTEERPNVMENMSFSTSSVHSARINLPFLTPVYSHQEFDKEFEGGRILGRSLASLVPSDPPNLQITPSVLSRCYLLQRPRCWNMQVPSFLPLQSRSENKRTPVAGDWKPGTTMICTSDALSPLSSGPGFYLSSFHADGLQQPRSQREPQDVNLTTMQMDGGVIPEGGLAIVNLLLWAAEAVDTGNTEMAKAILARLNQHISPTREKSIHRVAHHFRQALITRIMGVENFPAKFTQTPTLTPLEEFHRINAYVRFCEISPYPKFAHFTANQAILEALAGEKAVHVIDFQMGAGAQWASFLRDIASLRATGKLVPTVRLTAVGTQADEIRATGANLCHFAQMMNIALEFQAVVTRPECLDVSMLELRVHEAVAGNFIFSLHELLDEGASSGLSAVLKSLLEARPKVVTVVEQEANHSGPCFQQRFSEALQYYIFLFDSLTSSLDAGADSSVNSSIESHLLAPEIMNIVAYDGVARVERHERLGRWRERLLAAGFRPRSLSNASKFQAEKLVTQISARQGFVVDQDQGSLLLGWQGRPLMAASSWIC